ncbi:response regulator transcription factor [Virgisporangium ochraceum]|uniref:DNA-binding response regulator n=1 Tax=Virgisporangium ochraceum TaxID=65505 RepID=A0A8J3ZJW4_9ACTN|nr:response regulator transcription factor [Virgisporangium ochraceum]GIJ65086.1 DNA-binding response regulator [Virgisporangium ochraceum]
MPIRVVIADDQAMVREGFSVLLGAQDGIEVVGEAGDGREAIARVERLRPDVVLMDVRMPVVDGLEATRRITAMDAAPKVVILTTFDLDEYVYAALRAGASGFLLKTASARVLADAVRVVAAGEAMLAPTVTRRLIAEFARLRPAPPPVRPDVLTARETEILTLVAGGLSNAEIAARLVIAEQTVKTHVGRILTKLGLRDRTQAAIYAYAAGLADPGI